LIVTTALIYKGQVRKKHHRFGFEAEGGTSKQQRLTKKVNRSTKKHHRFGFEVEGGVLQNSNDPQKR
jgi:hypothetical protein